MLFKSWVQSSFWIQQPEFHENVINSPMPCLISMIIAILIPYILFQTMVYCGVFSPKYLWKYVNQLCLYLSSLRFGFL